MRRFFFAAIFAVVVAGFGRADNKPSVTKLELADGDTLVFLGDSITHQCLYTQYVEDYFYTRYPERRIKFHNSGVGGDRCTDALVRFEDDVAKFKPKYVTVLLGMNDGGYQSFNQQIFDTYERDALQVVDKIKGIGATPVLMTPTMFDARAARVRGRGGDDRRNTYYNSTLAYYGARLREMAFEQGLGFVDMYGPLNQITFAERNKKADFTLIKDAVHPDAPGQVVMAAAILNDMNVERLASNIAVSIKPDGGVNLKVTGKQEGEAKVNGATLGFACTEKSLPWVLPQEAELGYKLTAAGHRLSRQALSVRGLKDGKYELKIDGQAVGVYTDDQLARGVELQGNDKTPQYQQALKVATLNKERNDKAIRPLRNLWVAKKGLRYTEAALKNKPDDAKLKEQFDRQSKSLENFDVKVSELLDKGKEIEDRIYKANQPQKHTFELVAQK